MTWLPETVPTELDAALRDLSTAERLVLERHWLAMSRQAIDSDRPRVSHVFHVLAVAAAEEGDRRATVLAAIADDLEPVEAGELVEDLPSLLKQLRTEWIIDDGPAST